MRTREPLKLVPLAIVGLCLSSWALGAPMRVPKLPAAPSRIASNGEFVLIGAQGGALLWWRFHPGISPGPLVKAHSESGPLIFAGAGTFVSSGGWDPTIKLWAAGDRAPRRTLQPLTGRVTALCVQGPAVLVAGSQPADKKHAAAHDDQAPQQPGQLVAIDPAGKTTALAIEAKGQISGLACGPAWLLAQDSGRKDSLILLRDGKQSAVAVSNGPVTALTSHQAEALFADAGGIFAVSPAAAPSSASSPRQVAKLDINGVTVTELLTIGESIYGLTSEGLIRWPDAQRITRKDISPVAITSHGNSLLVLWEDGLLEEREAQSSKVVHKEQVPYEK